MVPIYFCDFFDVPASTLEEYGAFNISLINDLPLFIDPFLLFNSSDPTYQQLHENIIRYVKFLRDKSATGLLTDGLISAWYRFGEVRQNWLGYSKQGNRGSGLGTKFATGLNRNLHSVFADFGQERVARGSHLEKLCLISDGIGRDNISDFTTNLIKEFLLEYTQQFAIKYIHPERCLQFSIDKVCFSYQTESWESRTYKLPVRGEDYIILTPRNILRREDIWINRSDLLEHYADVVSIIPNDELRGQMNNYINKKLRELESEKKEEREAAAEDVIRHFPILLDYYIKKKEDEGDQAVKISTEQVAETELLFIERVKQFVREHLDGTDFYRAEAESYTAAMSRVQFLKHVIENNDGYRLFYVGGKPLRREADLQRIFRLTWFATTFDVNSEMNNGRGPADYSVSRGSKDKSLVEFKLASNSQLKKNLEKQVEIYQLAGGAKRAIKVILYFTPSELKRVQSALKDLKMENNEDIVLIDARDDNRPSASVA